MAKTRLTKGELKRQRDALGRYLRYLPTLQLKKQQLQIEILRQLMLLEERENLEQIKKERVAVWAGLLADPGIDIHNWVSPKKINTSQKNIAGVNLAVFENAEFEQAEYDLFIYPLWVDAGIEALRDLAIIRAEIKVIGEGIGVLRHELRITAQRVNLFEKVKIPEAEEEIRLIKVYLGDQMANAVGRSKIAKRKIEALELSGVAG